MTKIVPVDKKNILSQTVDGIAFFTNRLTGESGMSPKGLARFAGVTDESIEQILTRLETTAPEHIKADVLKPFAGKSPYMEIPGISSLKIVKDDVCSAILEFFAFDAKTTTEAASFAFRKFAARGMRQAIQQQTGYEPPKPVVQVPDSIAKYYISEQFRPWEQSFPEEFYQELYRLRGWDYALRKENKPYVVGKYINDIIYKRLPVGVMSTLKEANPVNEKGYRPYRYHQILSEGQGRSHLEKQIAVAVSLMKASDTWDQFKEMLNRATPKNPEDEETLDIAPLT